MTHTEKTEKIEKIKSLVIDMINESHDAMIKKVDNVLKSGLVDLSQWDENINPMILPKSILSALLQHESSQYDGSGTCFEKEVKNNVKKIKYIL